MGMAIVVIVESHNAQASIVIFERSRHIISISTKVLNFTRLFKLDKASEIESISRSRYSS
jgi:hypothetical protein